MTAAQNKLWNALKERRFTTAARILGEKLAIGARVQLVDDDSKPAAWWNHVDKIIVLNDAVPRAKDRKWTLIWQRAKLFHELFHLLFTTHDTLRAQLAKTSRKPARFLWVSNALEDGRIEFHGGKIYEGAIWYIRTLLHTLVTENNPDSGLLLYVRTHKWRNAKEAQFWSRFQKLIDDSIVAPTSKTVWHNAWDIVEAMEKKPEPKKPVCRCPDCGAPMPAGGAKVNVGTDGGVTQAEIDGAVRLNWLQMAMSVCATCGQVSSDDGGGDGGGQGGGEPSDDEGTPTNDGDGDGDSENNTDTEDDGEDSDGGESGTQSTEDDDGEDAGGEQGGSGGEPDEDDGDDSGASEPPSEPPTDAPDQDILDEIENMVEDALDRIDEEVQDELVDLQAELATYVQEQEYATPAEEQVAAELTEVFSSVMVESERQRWEPCKRGGSLDARRLVETQTGGVFMHEQIEKLSQPHIVLVIDDSASMGCLRGMVGTAARVINGAIQASGAVSTTITFGGERSTYVPESVVPLEGFKCDGYSTPTHRGLEAAQEWLDRENALRGMIIVITDGAPTSPTATYVRFDEVKNAGYYVVNVLLGHGGRSVKPDRLAAMSHDWVYVDHDVKELIRELETPLGNFIAGAF